MNKKEFIFLLTVSATTAVFWWLAQAWLADPFNWRETSHWLWPAMGLILTAALVTLFFLLVNRALWRFCLSLVILLEFLLVFRALLAYGLLGGVVIAWLFQAASWRAIEAEKENRPSFRLKNVLRTGLSRFLTAVFVLLSFAYFFTPGVQATALNQELPSVLSQAIQTLTVGYLGENLPLDDPRLKSQLSHEVLNQVTNWLRPYFKFFPPLMAFGLFLVLQGLRFLFWWLAFVFSAVIFAVFRRWGAVRVEKITGEMERVVF